MTCAPEERPDATPTGHRVGVEDAESEQGRLRAQGVETADTRHAATALATKQIALEVGSPYLRYCKYTSRGGLR